MATLISVANGNLTGATTFASATTDGQQLTGSGNTTTTASDINSASFALTAGLVLDGVLLQVRGITTTGTITVKLHDGTSVVASAVINASDIPQSGSNYRYLFFKFASSYTVPAGITAATLRIVASSAGNAAFLRDATAGNWYRIFRTTTTATRAASDALFIVGERAAGSNTTRTVTMDETSSATVPGAIVIGQDGVLAWGTSASTNYYLKMAGNLTIGIGGTMTCGSAGTPFPSTSTAILEFASTTAGQYGATAQNESTVTIRNTIPTTWRTKLAADIASAATTTWTTSTQLSGKSGDEVALVSTSRTGSETCKRTLASDITGTSLTVTAGPTGSAYSGSTVSGFDCSATIWLLSRTIKIRGQNGSTGTGYFIANSGATVDIQGVEFSNLGGTGNGCFDCQVTTGSLMFRYNTMHTLSTSSSTRALNLAGASGSNIEIRDSYIANTVSSTQLPALSVAATTGVPIVDNCFFGGSNSNVAVATLNDAGLTFTNNEVCSGGAGSNAGGVRITEADVALGTFSGNNIHGVSANAGLTLATRLISGTISNCKIWRNNATGLSIVGDINNITFDSCTLFGNNTADIGVSSGASIQHSLFSNCTVDGGVTSGGSFVSTTGFNIATGAVVDNTFFETCNFGTTVAHTTADFVVGSAVVTAILRACTLGSTVEVSGQASMIDGPRSLSYIASQKHDNTAGNHKTWFSDGTISSDSTISGAASPSARMTPNNATAKLTMRAVRVPVTSGQTATISLKVRKSVVGDGTAYNGNQPRMICQVAPEYGVASDTVMATCTNAANGAFETLTATTPTASDDSVFDIIVDCDGTTGWVNVDDAVVT